MSIANATQMARSKGDPKILHSGPSSLTGPDKLARALGWFSVGLGITELVAPGQLARLLGLQGKEGLLRAYGARELASAIPTLSVDKQVGLASRLAGDALDLATGLVEHEDLGRPHEPASSLLGTLVAVLVVLRLGRLRHRDLLTGRVHVQLHQSYLRV